MNNAMKLLACCAVVLAGCASGPKFSTAAAPSPGTALVYVFRPNSPPIALKPRILVNDVVTAKLTNKGYIGLELKPGRHTIRTDWSWNSGVPDGSTEVQVEAGQTYYVIVGSSMHWAGIVGTTSVFRFDGSIGQVDAKQAQLLMKDCGLVKKLNTANSK